jgi:trimethylamine--corrinoid protein Co-methyltransferase
MEANYAPLQTPQFRVLSDAQIERLYRATLECLSRTGVNVLNEEARHLLAKAGADVDGVRVRIPPHIIQDAIASTPRGFTIWGRDGRHAMHVVPDKVYYGPGPTCTYFIDPFTGERRHTRRGDPGMTARVCDALPNIDYVMSLGLISDVTPTLASVYEYAEMIANTTKPVLPWAFQVDQVKDLYAMALAVTGSAEAFRRRPLFGFFSTWQSPLIHTDHDLENVFWAVEHDIPVIYIGGGTAGSTGPVTGAGLIVSYLAGALSGLAILQLKKRGAPVCIGGVPEPMDLRTGRPAYGGPEMSLYSAAMSDISRYLGLPFMGTAGASEAKVVDQQAAIESTFQVLLSALSGATLVHDVGFLDCADIGSLEMLVMNDEIIAMTRRIMRGIEVTDETIMLDLIDQVGPGGEFMSTMETARLCRTEIWTPTLMDRDPWVNWEAAGSLTMLDRIRRKLHRILESHTPAPLPDGAAERIQQILEAAEERERSRAK